MAIKLKILGHPMYYWTIHLPLLNFTPSLASKNKKALVKNLAKITQDHANFDKIYLALSCVEISLN